MYLSSIVDSTGFTDSTGYVLLRVRFRDGRRSDEMELGGSDVVKAGEAGEYLIGRRSDDIPEGGN